MMDDMRPLTSGLHSDNEMRAPAPERVNFVTCEHCGNLRQEGWECYHCWRRHRSGVPYEVLEREHPESHIYYAGDVFAEWIETLDLDAI